MPKKLLNTLKYGSGKTKRKIYMMLGILAAGVVLTIASLVLGNLMLGLLAFLVLFVDGMILFNTSFEQKTVSVNQKEKTKRSKKEEEPVKEDAKPLAQYDEKKLKKLLVAYKVKKHHVPVLIEICSAEKIVQQPAYLWNDANYLYFLVLDEEPRLIKSRLSESDTIHIRRGMTARPTEEYPELNEPSVISMIFGSLLPKYYTVESSAYRIEHRKNMYSAAPGIWCTSGSVKNLMKILPARFVLDDGKTDHESVYYQEIYVARVMFYDGIYSGQEYKEKVLDVLGELIRADIADSVVVEYIDVMVMKGLIPKEYAEYVFAKRKSYAK